MTPKTFGVTHTTGYVEGEVQHYAMTDEGFITLPTELDMTAWDALSEDERAAICADMRTGGFGGWQKYVRKEGE